jgi:hypothetical protein
MAVAVAVVLVMAVLVKILLQQEAAQPVKVILAGLVVIITAHQKARTTAVEVEVAQEHKDIIEVVDMVKLAEVKARLVVLAVP